MRVRTDGYEICNDSRILAKKSIALTVSMPVSNLLRFVVGSQDQFEFPGSGGSSGLVVPLLVKIW